MPKLVVARHCVPPSPENPELSPLQQALLASPAKVRIADAPTGAGKSYAFQHAMKQGKRILFVVPTRRLAQNLAGGIIGELTGNAGWSRDKAEAKVSVWNSDATAILQERGEINITGYRVRQIQGLDSTRTGGEIIIAVPESLSHVLLRHSLGVGQSATNPLDIIANIDHIVFDEFHTIQPRGFGLAAVFAKLAATSDWGRAKVSFLSATPLSIRPVLERLGIPSDQIVELHEPVHEEGRPLHGDVELEFSQTDSLATLLKQHLEEVQDELEAGRQVVLIYDKLGDLQRELGELNRLFRSIGVPPDRLLSINSIDDSGGGTTAGGFQTGRHRNPDDFQVIVATASVEVGITFKAANLLIMEPGFASMNFLQRYGRAARRGADGKVWVRYDDKKIGKNPWLRELIDWANKNDSQKINIDSLTKILSSQKQTEFQTGQEPELSETRHFGTLSNRAIFTAGLYWNALLGHKSLKGERRGHLFEQRPSSSSVIYHWLKEVRAMANDRFFKASATQWCDRFEALAYTLRDIGERIRLVEMGGREIDVDLLWLRRETDILEKFPARLNSEGKDEIRLMGNLEDYLLDEKNRVTATMTLFFPHTTASTLFKKNGETVDAWCRELNQRSGRNAIIAWDEYPEAMRAAEKLVRCTGLLVDENDLVSMASGDCVL